MIGPSPVTMLTTPGGKTCWARSHQRPRGERGLLGGLHDDGAPGRQRRRELPDHERDGKVPRGDRGDDADRLGRTVLPVVNDAPGRCWAHSRPASPAKWWTTSIARATSAWASARGLPTSSVTSPARSGCSCRGGRRRPSRSRARSSGGRAAQAGEGASAARTARSTAPASAAAISPSSRTVAGGAAPGGSVGLGRPLADDEGARARVAQPVAAGAPRRLRRAATSRMRHAGSYPATCGCPAGRCGGRRASSAQTSSCGCPGARTGRRRPPRSRTSPGRGACRAPRRERAQHPERPARLTERRSSSSATAARRASAVARLKHDPGGHPRAPAPGGGAGG